MCQRTNKEKWSGIAIRKCCNSFVINLIRTLTLTLTSTLTLTDKSLDQDGDTLRDDDIVVVVPSINPAPPHQKSLSRLIEPHYTLLISNFDPLPFRSIANSYDLISCPWPPHDEAHFRTAAQGQSLIVAKSALTQPFCALGSNEPVKIVNIVNINTNTLFVDSCAPFSGMKIGINCKYCH